MTRGDGGGEPDATPSAAGSADTDATAADAGTGPTDDATGTGGEFTPGELADLAAEDWRAALAAAGELRPPVVAEIITVHGDRGSRAIEAVAEGRVKRYRDFTVVVGYRDEHVVEDGGCDCRDATYNLDTSDPSERCWHALAVDIADRVNRVDHHDMWYSEVAEFL
ncbi:Predicted nucleic acid-binding protein, contains Zn-finger domain [Halobaculum gomorrense]|uniref:Predicted nucleic acid-binding protein, contains Zn-finger domain n=1 Tax=Halobaculum gomorrense TaxID=43928 RepID=A0A1M5QJY9_9EURY|nr:Predicted nucleic acid-binding protein, contains Zn-finger domain [Halobaculum gomorrense]